jgi:4-carboxymuconolactone decarboxylase
VDVSEAVKSLLSKREERKPIWARVQFLEEEDLASEPGYFSDEIAARRGDMQRNFKPLLNSPVTASSMAMLGGYVRFETPLPARVKVLAVLAAPRDVDGDSARGVNQPQAKAAGLGDSIITDIEERHAPQRFAPEDAIMGPLTKELL